jgi:hypothetical protein
MKEIVLKLPIFGFIVATRAALGGGIGLLLSGKLSGSQRRAIGTALIAIGAISTVPAIISINRGMDRRRSSKRRERTNTEELPSGVRQDDQLTGTTRFPRGADDEFVSP